MPSCYQLIVITLFLSEIPDMNLKIKEVKNNSEMKDFIFLPERLHRNHKNWVPPIYIDERDYFNPKKNVAFSYCDTILLLAIADGEIVGRIMGIINHPYNQLHNEKHARFCYLETTQDPNVFNALIRAIEEWGRQKGMKKLVGPLAFSDKDPQGFLIEGYEHPVAVATNYNFPYMVDLVENYGFEKKLDLVVYKIVVPETLPPVALKVLERYKTRQSDIKILEFKNRRKVKPFIRPVFELVNITFTDIYGFSYFSEKEMDDFAGRFLFMIDPRYIVIAVNGKNEVIAFILGMSDISEGIIKARGRLLPFGFIHLLRAAKKTKQLNLLMGAIHPDYQGRGIDMLIGTKMLTAARETGKTIMDSHLEMETNFKVRAEMERMGGTVYKRFRIWQKDLD